MRLRAVTGAICAQQGVVGSLRDGPLSPDADVA